MADINDPRPVLRQELARVFKNPRVVRAFEKIFDLIPPEFINQQIQLDTISLASDLAAGQSFEALSAINRLTSAIETLAVAPRPFEYPDKISPTSAPPIDVNMTVTWTGVHTFGAGLNATGTVAVTGNITATTTIAATGAISGSNLSATGGANPSVSLGLAAVNGAAITYMRSDAAPALDQGITPTWTGKHIFSKSVASGDYPLVVSSTVPGILINETDGTADNRNWNWVANGSVYHGQLVNDALNVASDWVTITPSGGAIAAVAFPTTLAKSFLVGLSTTAVGGCLAEFKAAANNVCMTLSSLTSTFEVLDVWNRDTAGNNIFVNFGTEAAFTVRGSITYNRAGGLTVYNTVSDARLKKDIVDASPAAGKIDIIKVRAFEWIDSGIKADRWFIAQELHEVCPSAVTPGHDDVPWSVDASKLVPLLIQEIQELRKRVANLERQ